MGNGRLLAGKLLTNLAVAGAVIGCAAGVARADTVVLKNGQRITVQSAERENGKVICETAAGTLTFAESNVLRIESGRASAQPAEPASNPAADSLKMGLPSSDVSANDAAMEQAVVHDGELDLKSLEEADSAASGGGPQEVSRVIAAEAAATRFELERNELSAALSHAERALSFAPQRPALLLNVAYLHLRRGEYTTAMDFLERARALAPDSAEAAKLMGWADYGVDRLPETVEEWKRAQTLAPDPEIAAALAKAQREVETESSFRENHSVHFSMHYYGTAVSDLAFATQSALEEDFDQIASVLDYRPNETINVLLYTDQEFADITRAPSWVGALNDGKIRIPVRGLESVTPRLAGVLKHELTHSFINEETRGQCPIWLQEGLAQWMEGKRSGGAAPSLLALYDRRQDPSLTLLSDSWMSLPTDVATTAYAWSLAVVETLEADGPGDVNRMLSLMGRDTSAEAALQQVFHTDYTTLGTATNDYLRKTYAPATQPSR